MFAIHIGNTYASIAFCKENGKTEVIANEIGDRLTPTVAVVENDEITVGMAAAALGISDTRTTISCNKSLMGKDTDRDIKYYNNIEIEVKNNEMAYCIPIGDKIKCLKPQKIVTLILKDLLVIAKSALCDERSSLPCVLLSPGDFSDDYCKSYKHAAESVGWRVLQIINEAAAAILTFSLLENIYEPTQTIVVYRLGGTTCDITGCEVSDGMMTTLGSIRREDIGGNVFVDVLVDFLAEQFFKKYKVDPRKSKRSVEKLKRASQNCFHVLSNLSTSNCFIESLHDGIDFSISLSRARFELLAKPILDRCIDPLKILLDQLTLNGCVDKVILCGGATNIPSLKQSISTTFAGSDTHILTHNNPEEVLVTGGAKQAYYLNSCDFQEMLPRSMDIFLDTSFI